MADRPVLVSIVFRVRKSKLESLKALVRESRIRQSEYLREAIWLLLKKHGAL